MGQTYKEPAKPSCKLLPAEATIYFAFVPTFARMEKIKTLLFDIRFWIIVLFLIRLENINLPPLEEHSWRQCITMGVARNFLEWDPYFFHPRTVITDSRTGIQAQEFPLYNYVGMLLWKVFGQHTWCFRLLTLLVASIGLYYFYQLARRLTDTRTALASAVLFGTSVAFIYGRKAMPDVFAVSLVIMGVYHGYRYWDERQTKHLVWFGLLISIGVLCKMPAACVLGFLLWPFINRLHPWRSKLVWVGVAALAMIPVALWYFIWVVWASETYKHPLFYPVSLSVGWKELLEYWPGTVARFYPIALTSKLAFVAAVVGLGWAIWSRQKAILWSFVGCFGLLFFFMLKAGMVFSGHDYYIIPFVPMMALLAGYGLSNLARKDGLFLIVLTFMAAEAIYQHKYDFFVPYPVRKFQKLESIVNQYVPKDARILVNGGNGSPTMLYFAHRNGWTTDDRMKDTAWVKGEYTVGMSHLVIQRSHWNEPLPFPLLFEDEDFRVYKVVPD
jgi:hypothetical protein